MKEQQTFLVTGGAGFIGVNLTKKLVTNGKRVIVVDNLSAGTDPSRLPKEVEFNNLDIRDTVGLVKVCEGVDVIVHLAALPRIQISVENPVETHDVNINGTLSVLEAAKKTKVKRVVYAASSSAYGEQEKLPLSTDLRPQPKSPYALQKYVGEELLRLWSELYDIETVSLRFFNVYGPYMDPDGPYALVIGKFLQMRKRGEALTITGDGEQTRDFTYVDDVVQAILQAAELNTVGRGEVLNVGGGKQTSINEIARMIGGEVKYIEIRHEARHTLADITETKRLLKWEPEVTIEEGIEFLKKEVGLVK